MNSRSTIFLFGSNTKKNNSYFHYIIFILLSIILFAIFILFIVHALLFSLYSTNYIYVYNVTYHNDYICNYITNNTLCYNINIDINNKTYYLEKCCVEYNQNLNITYYIIKGYNFVYFDINELNNTTIFFYITSSLFLLSICCFPFIYILILGLLKYKC